MKSNFFEVLRPGINSTFQDLGRENFYHIGLPFSGAMDNRNYLLSNTLVNNKYEAAIEFAYQGPLLKYYGKSTVIAVTGDVNFSITKKNKKLINGECYKNYVLENEDELDIISTNKSVYGLFISIRWLCIRKNFEQLFNIFKSKNWTCLLYTSPSPRDR